MSDFGTELASLMSARGVGVRELARAVYVNPGHVSNLRNGKTRPSPELARKLDDYLSAGGALAARAVPQGKPPRSSRVAEALAVAAGGEHGDTVTMDGLADLVGHYAHVIAVAPSAAVYDELVGARTFASTLLDRGSPGARAELSVTAGWLSSLLAISSADLGDHAAAVIWCADAGRRGADAKHPELAGWAALTRSLIAWYLGDAARSATAASRGLSVTSKGTAAYARLASQHMRCLAMLGDTAGMTAARRRAAEALGALAPSAGRAGVYSVVRADDPPYTATSLLVAGQHKQAAAMTRRLIATAYPSAPGDKPTSYARTLLILALAAAGSGDADEAAAAGTAALAAGRIVWPTMVLAARLDNALTERAAGSAHAAEFRAALADAGTRLALTAARGAEGQDQ